MAGFTFCCGDFAEMMDAKGTVTNEILEMIEEATPEEKHFLSSKISTLETKITPGK